MVAGKRGQNFSTASRREVTCLAPLETALRAVEAQKACQLIEQNSTIYAQLWDTLQESAPSYKRFVTLGFTFMQLNKRIKRIWRRLYITASKGNAGCVSARFVSLYGAYAEQILHDDRKALLAQELSDRSEILIQDEALSQYIGPGNAVVGVSANRRSLGRMDTFNSAFCELTGYGKNELKGLALSKLIPQIYRETHERLLERQSYLMDAGETRSVCPMQCDSFVLHKSRYIVPVALHVVAMPNYTNNYCFLVRIKKISTSDYKMYHILADNERVISSVTSSNNHSRDNDGVDMYNLLRISIEHLKAGKVRIAQLLPELAKIPEKSGPKRTRLNLLAEKAGDCCRLIPRAKGPAEEILLNSCLSFAEKISVEAGEESLDVTCEWNSVVSGNEILGSHYIIKEVPTVESMNELVLKISDASWTHFAYNGTMNGYVQQSRTDCTAGRGKESTIGPSRQGSFCDSAEAAVNLAAAAAVKLVPAPKSMPKFYEQVLPRLEKLGDPVLLDSVFACCRIGR